MLVTLFEKTKQKTKTESTQTNKQQHMNENRAIYLHRTWLNV